MVVHNCRRRGFMEDDKHQSIHWLGNVFPNLVDESFSAELKMYWDIELGWAAPVGAGESDVAHRLIELERKELVSCLQNCGVSIGARTAEV